MVLIYGGTGAIGGAIARRLRDDGVAVHLVGRDGGKADGMPFTQGDVGDPDTFARATEAAAEGGRLDGLVYAIGTIRLKPFHRLTDAEALEDYEINALGALRAVQAARQALISAEGAVLLFSTVAVSQGFASHAAVAMAKGAVEGLTRTLAAELAPKVRVNALAPSLTLGGMGDAVAGSDKMMAALAHAHPLKRLGAGEDMAALAAALLAPRAWITGQVIGVDGGRGALRTHD